MNLKSTLLALLVVAIWGSNFPIIKTAVGEISPFAFLAMRFFITGLLFLPFVKWPGWKTFKDVCFIGLLIGILHQGFMFYGIQTTSAGTMSILLQTQVIMTTLLGWLFLKETIGWRTWTGITMGFLGIVVLMGGPDLTGDPLGYAYGAFSALFIAWSNIHMRHLKNMHSLTYIVLVNLPIAPIMLGMAFFYDGTAWVSKLPDYNWMILAPALAYQVLLISSSHMLWQKLVEKHPISHIVPFCLLIPVFGILGGVMFLDEPFTLQIFIGGVMTLFGVGIIILRKIQKKQAVEVESPD